MNTAFARDSARAIVPLFVVLVVMVGVTTPRAFAQDRTARSAETTDPSASQSGLLSRTPASWPKLAINRADSELNQSGEPKDGLYPELGNMITGSGWVSMQAPATVSTCSTVTRSSTCLGPSRGTCHKMAQGRFELPRLAHDHLSVGAQAIYQDLLQVNYFGIGNNSLQSNPERVPAG